MIYLFQPWWGGNNAEAAWISDSWAFRKEIKVSESGSTETNVYLTISSYDASDTSKYQSDCGDIRFTDVSGNILPYTISSCGASTTFHVNMQTILTGTNATLIYLYYGNPSSLNGFSATDVYSACSGCSVGTTGSETNGPGSLLYWRFDDASGTSANDSTSNVNTGTLGGTTVPTWQTEDQCITGKCLYFDGSTSKVTGSKAINSVKTVALWVRPNTIASVGLVDLNDASSRVLTTNASGVISATNFTSPTYYINGNVTTSPTLIQNQWNYVVVTTGTGVTSGTAVKIGTNNSAFTKGFFDEVKIYDFALSADQVKANFNARGSMEGAAEVLGTGINNQPAALSNGLVGYWKMDETSWATNCSTNSILDSSGNSNNAAACPNGSAPAPTTGKFGNAGLFDATNDYADVNGTSGLNITSPSVTVAMWVYFSSLPGSQVTLLREENVEQYEIRLNAAGRPFATFSIGSSYNPQSGGTGNILTTSTWHHVAATYDGQSINLYQDGVLVNSTAYAGTQLTSTTPSVKFGESIGGREDEVRIYNRALSSAEVAQLYNFAPGPVLYYPLEDGSGTTVADKSGNGNTGSFTSTPTWSPGKYGKSLKFDGVDDKVTAGSALTQVSSSFTGVTYSAWVNMGNTFVTNKGILADGVLLMRSDSGGGTNNLGGCIGNAPNGCNSGVVTITNISNNTWYYLTITSDGTTVSFYADGVLKGTQTQGTGSRSTLLFGVDSNSNYWPGLIDEVKVYNYVRTPAQIIEDMNGSHPAPGSPVGSSYGYWRFDEGADNTCPTVTTNDVCNIGTGGAGIDGAQSNMASPGTSTSGWTTAGKFGKALNFDGTDDFVSIGDESGTDSVAQATWTFWTRPGTLATQKCIWCKVGAITTTPTNASWAIVTDSSDSSIIRAAISNGAADVSQYGSTPTGTLVNGIWSHIIVVYDGTQANADRIKFYVNGKPVTTTITGTIPTTIRNSTAVAAWGRSSGTAVAFYSGTIDEPKLYVSALTASQAMAEYNRGSGQVQGALSTSSTAGNDNASSRTAQSQNSEYCIPGDSSTCTAPVGRWDFEEGTGSTVNDVSGNAKIATAGNFGTLTDRVIGKFGKGFNFTGTTNNTGGVDTNSTYTPPTQVTLEAWIYPKGSGGSGIGRIFASDDDNTVSGYLLTQQGTSCYRWRADWTTDGDWYTPTSSVILNAWQHIAVTYDASSTSNSPSIYINGKLQSLDGTCTANVTPVGTWGNTADNWGIGGGGNVVTNNFNGVIDNVKVFDYQRSAAQIAWDYNHGGPVAYWRLDDCQGTSTIDSTGNGNTGTKNGSSTTGTCSTSSTFWGGSGGTGAGKRNYAPTFDGSSDYVSIPDAAMLNFSSGPFSVGAWFKTSTTTTGKRIISKWGDFTHINYEIYINSDTTTGGLTAGVYDGSYTPYTDATGINYADGNWHHAMFVVNSTNTILYVDGIQRGTSTHDNSFPSTGNVVQIGAATSCGGCASEFNGQIDDARVYNYALTPQQVQAVMNEGAMRTGPVTGAP